MTNNIRVAISIEYEDTEGALNHWNEQVDGELENIDSVENQTIEAVARIMKNVKKYRDQPIVKED